MMRKKQGLILTTLLIVTICIIVNINVFNKRHVSWFTPESDGYDLQNEHIREFYDNLDIEYNDDTDIIEKTFFDNSYRYSDEFTLQKHILDPSGANDLDQVMYYNMDPRFSYTVLLQSVLKDKRDGKNMIKQFSWYDFVDNHEYNKFLKLNQLMFPPELHLDDKSGEDVHVDCMIMFKSWFPLDQLEYIETLLETTLFDTNRNMYDDPVFIRNMKRVVDRVTKSNKEQYCTELNNEDMNRDYKDLPYNEFQQKYRFVPPVKSKKLLDFVRPEVFVIQAKNYVINTMPPPLSITILHSSDESYQIEIQQALDQQQQQNFVQSGMLNDLLSQTSKTVQFNNITKVFQNFISEHKPLVTNEHLRDTKNKTKSNLLIHLQESLFEFNVSKKIMELDATPPDKLTNHQVKYLENLKHNQNQHYSMDQKSLHEPGNLLKFNNAGRHFDMRFFNGEQYFADKHLAQIHLSRLVQVFLDFTQSNGLLAWIAHGNLLAYLNNGKSFYWDSDVDVQMPIEHLNYLAEFFNQSLVVEDPRHGSGRYFVDVGQNLLTRHNGIGNNNIDARFIDVDSGLYIDITGLSFSSEYIHNQFLAEYENMFLRDNDQEEGKPDPETIRYHDPNSIEDLTDLTIEEYLQKITSDPSYVRDDQFEKAMKKHMQTQNEFQKRVKSVTKDFTPQQRYSINKSLKIVNCKNRHFLTLDQLSPMMNTLFQNRQALVPHKLLAILREEYKKASNSYSFTTFMKYMFLPSLKDWIDSNYILEATNRVLDKIHSIVPDDENALNDPFQNIFLEQSQLIVLNLCDSNEDGITHYVNDLKHGFSQTTYRLKELEILNNKEEDWEQKLHHWKDLLANVGPRITPHNTFKDPFMNIYDSRLLEKSSTDKTTPQFNDLKKKVCFKSVKDLIIQMEQLHNNALPMLQTEEIDFNLIGRQFAMDSADDTNNLIFDKEFWDIPENYQL